jgi:hypothetical protein
MKHKTKKILFFMTICFIFGLSSCQKDVYDDAILSSKRNILTEDFSMKSINGKSNSKLLEAMNKVLNLKLKSDARMVHDSIFDFYFDDEKGKHQQCEEKNTYTFQIHRPNEDGKIENIMFSLKPDGNYDAYFVKYDFTKEAYENMSLEEFELRNKEINYLNTSNGLSTLRGYCIEYYVDPRFFKVVYTIVVSECGDNDPGNSGGGTDAPSSTPGGSSSNNNGNGNWGNNGPAGNGNTNGTGGGSSNPNNPQSGIMTTPVLEAVEQQTQTPCEKIKSKTSNTAYMIKFNAINTQQNFDLPYETGFIERKISGNIHYIDGTATAANGGNTLVIPNNASGFTHVHNNHITTDENGNNFDGTVKMLSPEDLGKLITSCNYNASLTQDAYGVMISDQAIYSINILDGDIDLTAVNAKWPDFEENYKYKAGEILKDTSLTNVQKNQELQKMMLSEIDKLGITDKVGLFQGNVQTLPNGTKKINWTRKTLDANNNLIPTPCL